MRRVIAAMALAGIALGGCQTMEERIAKAGEQCALYGFPRESPQFSQCVLAVDQSQQQLAAQRYAAAMNYLAATKPSTATTQTPYGTYTTTVQCIWCPAAGLG